MSFANIVHASADGQVHNQNDLAQEGRMLGRRMEYDDGRKWRFVKAGATLLVPGDIVQGPAVVAGDYTDIIVDVAAAIGATSVSVTPTTTTAANVYGDTDPATQSFGHMFVNKGGVRAAVVYRVKSHVLFAASAGKIITLQDPLLVALAVNDEVGFAACAYNGVVAAPQTTLTNRVVGVAQKAVTAAYFGWVQTGGIAVVNSAASQVIGNRLLAVLASAGRVGVSAETVAETQPQIGVALSVPTTAGEFGAIFLTID